MIFVTGGTGFIGQVLIRQLVASGKQVRVLIRPNMDTSKLPQGVPVEVAVSNLTSDRELRAAMRDVKIVYHLAGDERSGSASDLAKVDVEGTETLAKTAVSAGVERIVYVSHLGAEKSSAFPLLRAKGIAEQAIIQSGVPYTIFKTGPVFGDGDHFTSMLVRYLKLLPFVTLLPGDGQSKIHPIWVEDLVTCMVWAIEDLTHANSVYSVGGAEYFTIQEFLEMLARHHKMKRLFLHLSPPAARLILLFWEQMNKKLPISSFQLDYLSMDRTAPLDTLPRIFGLLPTRFTHYLTNE